MIGAAFQAFMEKGYAGTSTLEIATRAKISKRDLYANFPNKRAILLACIASRAAQMRLPPDLPAPQSRDTLVSILTRFGATVVREVCQPEVIAMFRLAISEAERSLEVAETLNASRSVNRDALAELLAGAQAAEILCDGDPRQMMERFSALLWGDLMVGRLKGLTAPPEPAEIDRRAHEAAEALLKLDGNPTGWPLIATDQGFFAPVFAKSRFPETTASAPKVLELAANVSSTPVTRRTASIFCLAPIPEEYIPLFDRNTIRASRPAIWQHAARSVSQGCPAPGRGLPCDARRRRVSVRHAE